MTRGDLKTQKLFTIKNLTYQYRPEGWCVVPTLLTSFDDARFRGSRHVGVPHPLIPRGTGRDDHLESQPARLRRTRHEGPESSGRDPSRSEYLLTSAYLPPTNVPQSH